MQRPFLERFGFLERGICIYGRAKEDGQWPSILAVNVSWNNPTVKTMEKISIALGCNISELFVGLPERFAVLLENTLPCRFVDHGPVVRCGARLEIGRSFPCNAGRNGNVKRSRRLRLLQNWKRLMRAQLGQPASARLGVRCGKTSP